MTDVRRSIRLLLGPALAATLLAGCGGEDTETTAPAGGSTSSPSSAPATTPADEPAAEPSALPVPEDGPSTIKEFPVPADAQILDLGPPLSGNWQFGITSPDPATTVEFYKETLGAEGYKLKENVQVKVGANTIDYDLAFYGDTYGIVSENDLAGGTLITVDDEPIDGLAP
jgi:hypothetical protein